MARLGGIAQGLNTGMAAMSRDFSGMLGDIRQEEQFAQSKKLQDANLELAQAQNERAQQTFDMAAEKEARKNKPIPVDTALEKMIPIPGVRDYVKNYVTGMYQPDETGNVRAEDMRDAFTTVFKEPAHLQQINKISLEHHTKRLGDITKQIAEAGTGADIKNLLIEKASAEEAIMSAKGADEGLVKYLTATKKTDNKSQLIGNTPSGQPVSFDPDHPESYSVGGKPYNGRVIPKVERVLGGNGNGLTREEKLEDLHYKRMDNLDKRSDSINKEWQLEIDKAEKDFNTATKDAENDSPEMLAATEAWNKRVKGLANYYRPRVNELKSRRDSMDPAAKTGKQLGGQPVPAVEKPPVEGAQKAKDGNWYVKKDGKNYRVDK